MRLYQLAFVLALFGTSLAGAQCECTDNEISQLQTLGDMYTRRFFDRKKEGETYDAYTLRTGLPRLDNSKFKGMFGLLTRPAFDKNVGYNEKFFVKPDTCELRYWYFIRLLRADSADMAALSSTAVDRLSLAREYLTKDINYLWLVDNYYFMLQHHISLEALSKYEKINFQLGKLGLTTKPEKAIFYFNMTLSLNMSLWPAGSMGAMGATLKMADRFPLFDSKPFYEYKDFDCDDFDWVVLRDFNIQDANEKDRVSYRSTFLGVMYEALVGYCTIAEAKHKNELREAIYSNSILSESKYFRFSGREAQLTKMLKERQK